MADPLAKVPDWPRRLLIVGCGNMGGAMLAGWLRAGFDPGRFTVVDPQLPQAPEGVTLLRELPVGEVFDLMLLGVKPQMLDGVAPALTALGKPWWCRYWLAWKSPALPRAFQRRAGWCG